MALAIRYYCRQENRRCCVRRSGCTTPGSEASEESCQIKAIMMILASSSDKTTWGTVSDSAKALVRSLLTVQPAQRASASAVLSGEWLGAVCTKPVPVSSVTWSPSSSGTVKS